LRRHLGNAPLRGVANRSLGERWDKWRRRRPHALTLVGMGGVLLLAVLIAGVFAWRYVSLRRQEAEAALNDAHERGQSHDFAEAVHLLQHGLDLAENLPASGDLRHRLAAELEAARYRKAAQDLHQVVEQLRFLYGMEGLPAKDTQTLLTSCYA